ncbi:uncharacterized protein KY384_007143 [Bacidia gigantensis]|uniref:uncharacterized protein n=1 Tax=Bacidia gigantensis TaxID=2732470 RepID=UPI001D040FFC|nr:uncharacterized protein KY384_007143 [Bacidia gigantensis]KAG8528226.1 hypothetical protein KY384_007143 [Bacidia gigantensis]
MTDPFSIAVGILTIVGACSKGVKSLRTFDESLKEYVRLETELNHLHDVINFVDGLGFEHQLTSHPLTKNLTLVRDKLQEVHNFIQKSLRHSHLLQIKRRRLVWHKNQLNTFARDIETAKAHIVDSMVLSNLYYTLHLSTQLAGTHDFSPQFTSRSLLDHAQPTVCAPQTGLHGFLTRDDRKLADNSARVLQLNLKPIFDEEDDEKQLGLTLKGGSKTHNGTCRQIQNPDEVFESTPSETSDVFDDCVSHLSDDSPRTQIDRLQAHFMSRASPDDFFQNPLTFFGESYTIESRLGDSAAVVAMTEIRCSSINRLQKYFLIYAESPRLWRRVTVSAKILRSSGSSIDSQVAAPDLILSTYKTLPGDLQYQLQELLKSTTLLDTVTRVSMTVTEYCVGKYMIDTPSVVVSEDLEETQRGCEQEMLREIEHTDRQQYLQSEIIVQERLDAVTYIAQVESRSCMERKMPFRGAGMPGDNGLNRFWQDLRLAKSLYECNGVVKLIGVVLDDSRTHLKSFLQELPALGTIRSILAHAELRGERVPWSVRAAWASQIITTVAEIHSKGFVAGLLHINFTGVQSDGRAVLNLRKRGYRHSINREGEIAPESRTVPIHSVQPRELNFASDIFMLGMLLFHLAEHRIDIAGYLCMRNACTSVPRHSCPAGHINPVELPPCTDREVPEAFNTMIYLCRQADPTKRPPARKLLRYSDANWYPPEMVDLRVKYANTHGHLVDCNECGAGVGRQAWYHCNICHLADFDLCSSCVVSQGIHCLDRKHQLLKRTFKDGRITNVM